MAEITFRGNKKLESINEDQYKKFPYLYLSFYKSDGSDNGASIITETKPEWFCKQKSPT